MYDRGGNGIPHSPAPMREMLRAQRGYGSGVTEVPAAADAWDPWVQPQLHQSRDTKVTGLISLKKYYNALPCVGV